MHFPKLNSRLKSTSSHLLHNGKSVAHLSEDFRCNLEFCDRSLNITYIKRDEGFESDGESSTTTNGERTQDNVDGTNGGVEIKIIKDHVSEFQNIVKNGPNKL